MLIDEENANIEPSEFRFTCASCKFNTNNPSNFATHNESKKHLRNIVNAKTQSQPFTEKTQLSTIVTELIRQNSEFQQMLVDRTNENTTLTKQLIDIAKDNKSAVNINNTITNKFNLNFFLNDQCKEALNVTDFVKYLCISTTDVSNFGESGYVKGICDIVVRGLNELGEFKRPIHCSDAKRNTIYIKDNNVWEKDTNNKLHTHLIRCVNTKSINAISDWELENPSSKNMMSATNNQYLTIIRNSMSGRTDAEIEMNIKRIVQVLSDKTSISKQM